MSVAPFKAIDTFTLVAWKTKHFLASKREEMRFDSVYVGADNVQAEWMLKNVSDGEITVADRRITALSPVVGTSGFSVVTPLDVVKMPHDSHLPWTLRYRPVVRGTDSARLALVYSPNIKGRTDFTLLLLQGIGVEQHIVLSNRTSGLPNPVVIRGDTIDVGDIDVGDSTTVQIILKNRGNIPFGGTAHCRTIPGSFLRKRAERSAASARRRLRHRRCEVSPLASGDVCRLVCGQ